MLRTLIAILCAAPPVLLADGGAVQLQQETGPFVVTVFASPAPLRAGPVDISVLVQSRDTLQSVLDADVSIRLQEGNLEINTNASHASAQNKVLYAALVNLARPGQWNYSVSVRRGTALASVSSVMACGPAEASLASHWGAIGVVPLCILLFIAHQSLRRRGRAHTAAPYDYS